MKKFIMGTFALSALLAVSACSDDKHGDEPLPVGDEWIDPVFAQVLQERGYITDAETVTPLDVSDLTEVDVSGTYENRGSITSVRGLEHFNSLKKFYCRYNQLTALDVSKNTQLEYLYCEYNSLTALDVSKNTLLTRLRCNNNPGENGKFKVTAWFDQSSIPSENFTTGSWRYDGSDVSIEYIKAN